MTGSRILPGLVLAWAAAGGGLAEQTATSADVQKAVQAEWAGRGATAALGEAGRVVLIYGEAPTELVCAPLHICAVEFGPEEAFHDTPSLSDPVRWQLEVREGFAGGSKRQYLILKPAQSAEPAVLTAFTDRRFYSIRLIPDPTAWTPILSFRFPDDEAAEVQARIAAERQAAELAEAAVAAVEQAATERTGVRTRDGLVAAGELNFDYRIAGDAAFAPQRIYDDGTRTYIELPQSWRGELPVFHAGGDPDRVVNYRVDGRRYEIEGVYAASSLTLGRDRIRIRRE